MLYLFHSSNVLRSAFFYKLQKLTLCYLTLPNGLNKLFYPGIFRASTRALLGTTERMMDLVNEDKNLFFSKRLTVSPCT